MNGLIKAKNIVELIIDADNFAHQSYLDADDIGDVKTGILTLIHNARIDSLKSVIAGIDYQLRIDFSDINNEAD